ncbi:response regulator transcription factor [Francisella hispaniensis]|uniref:Transcriptional regulator n=1 Tax=Francisella hispaniensis FSC454 TaxID=1088883 RepID=A0AAC9NQC1_9GAMM|nr:response regulator transcription factor [Francisella hispaniensis]APD50982.1 transcriptional regulator [Francisella hispaniensis FSC454]KYW82834.1 transcriptional regulator [Francisella hispaniensis FSC454]
MKSILVVDDEKEIRINIRDLLEKEGYKVYIADSAETAERILNSEKIDLMLLDIMMPNESGLDFCKRICLQKNINIIIATASNDEIDQILAYEFGAKDYISKPFNRKLLLAKIKTTINSGLIRCRYLFFDGVVFDTLEKTIQNKQDILYQISNIEYKILLLLTENVYSFVNRDKISEAVYNRPYDGYSRSIDVTISKIRKKINDKDKVTILTSSQNGYSLNKEVKKFASQSDLSDFIKSYNQ